MVVERWMPQILGTLPKHEKALTLSPQNYATESGRAAKKDETL